MALWLALVAFTFAAVAATSSGIPCRQAARSRNWSSSMICSRFLDCAISDLN
jgi:hypothetical protein